MRYVFKKVRYKFLVFIIDSLGYVIFFFPRFFKKNTPLSPKKILVVRVDHIGDFVCTLPVFENLKLNFPQSKISVLINSSSVSLAKLSPHIDEIISVNPFWMQRGNKRLSFREIFKVIRELREQNFDLGFDMRGDFFSIALMFLGRVRYRVGYAVTGGGFLLGKNVLYTKNINTVERNFNLLRNIGVPIKKSSIELKFSDEDKNIVMCMLQDLSLKEQKSVILHPFAGTKAKQWSVSKFQELIDQLRKANFNIFVIGTKTDTEHYDGVCDVRGRFALSQLAFFIKHVGFFIGLDSGPANIAAVLDVPTIVICSGTNIPERWIFIGKNVKLVYRDTDCKPCELKICPKNKHYCMEDIGVGEVMGEVDRLIGGYVDK
ncbi:MAG: glycosyltransferase family 9 protein [Candidatus Omnitrophota bacterium]